VIDPLQLPDVRRPRSGFQHGYSGPAAEIVQGSAHGIVGQLSDKSVNQRGCPSEPVLGRRLWKKYLRLFRSST
jgi:hypothetical protein